MQATTTPGIYELSTALAKAKKEADAKIAAAQAQLDEDASPHRLRRERATRLSDALRAELARAAATVVNALDEADAAAVIAAVQAELATKAALELVQVRTTQLVDTERQLFAGRINALNARRRTVNRLANELNEGLKALWTDDRPREAQAERLMDEIKLLSLNA